LGPRGGGGGGWGGGVGRDGPEHYWLARLPHLHPHLIQPTLGQNRPIIASGADSSGLTLEGPFN